MSGNSNNNNDITQVNTVYCVLWLLLVVAGNVMLTGCSANKSVRHGNQEYILFGDTPEPAVSATDPIALNAVATETSELQPVYNEEERLGQLVNQAQDLLLDNDAEGAIEVLTEAQSITGWTQSRLAPRLLFWLGHAYDQLDENIAAIATYRQLVMRYPDSGSAKRAQKRLQQLSDDVK